MQENSYELHDLCRITKYLTGEKTKFLANTFVKANLVMLCQCAYLLVNHPLVKVRKYTFKHIKLFMIFMIIQIMTYRILVVVVLYFKDSNIF